MNPRFHSKLRLLRAFTLIELLVASGVTVLLVGFMVAILSNVSGFWTRSSDRLTAEAQARYALDQLTLDLQSAQFRDDGNTWLAVSIPNGTATSTFWDTRNNTVTKPTNAGGSLFAINTGNLGENSLTSPRFGQAGVWLRFFTSSRGSNTAATPSTFSNPVAVGWQIVRRASSATTGNTNIRYFLHRAEARPATTGSGTAVRVGTLDAGYSITGPAYTTSSGNNTGATTGDPRSVQIPGSATNLDSIIGENVIDFGVRLHVRRLNGASPTLIFPTGATATTYLASVPPRAGTTQFPEIADVMIRVLTDEGALLIAAFEAGRIAAPAGRSNAQHWWDLAIAHSHVFTRRINLRVQPL